MLPKVCAWITVITLTKIYWILPMHWNVTIKNVSWPHFSRATLYVQMSFIYIVAYPVWTVWNIVLAKFLACLSGSEHAQLPIKQPRFSQQSMIYESGLQNTEIFLHICHLYITPYAQMLSTSGSFTPVPLDQGCAHEPRWGVCPRTHYMLTLPRSRQRDAKTCFSATRSAT